MNEIFHFLKLQEYIIELRKYVFHWEKWNFEPTGKSAYTTKFLTLGNALLILLSLYLQMLIMQISTQKNNHKYRKGVATKVHFLKKWVWSFETLNSTFYEKWHFLYKMQTFWLIIELRSIRSFWNMQKCQNTIMIICYKFLRKKISTRN